MKQRRAVLVAIIVVVAGAVGAAPATAAVAGVTDSAERPTDPAGGVPAPGGPAIDANAADVNATGEEPVDVIVRFADTRARSQALSSGVVAQHGEVTAGRDISILPIVGAKVAPAAIPALEASPMIESVERDVTIRTTAETTPWGVDRLNARAAASSTGSAQSDVDVAVLDTGIDPNHPDVSATWAIDVSGSGTPNDRSGHGTKAAGIVAATDDDEGVVGVSPGVDLYSIKVLDGFGNGQGIDLITGINEALDGPDNVRGTADDADVISMSLGGSDGNSGLRDAMEKANASGVVLVASAGNSGDNDPATNEVFYPAKYDEVIAVAATTRQDRHANFLNGASADGEEVELSAPGARVNTTNLSYGGSPYGFFSGTSAAAPHVSGAAALVLAANGSLANGNLSRAEARTARRALQATARDVNQTGRDRWTGYGVVEANAAVELANGTPAPDVAVPPASGSVSPSAVDERTTRSHTLSFNVTGVSADGNTDDIYVSLPSTSGYVQGTVSPTVTDASGTSVSVTNSPNQNIDSVDGGTNNRVKLSVSPDRQPAVIDTTVELSFDASHGDVDTDRTGPITVRAVDSDDGDTATADVATLTVANTSAPLAVASESFSPSEVNNSTTRTHSLAFDLTGVTADGAADDLVVTVPLPNGGSLQSGSITATDSSGTDVTASSGVSNGNLTGQLNPTGGGTARVSINATFTAQYPQVDGAESGPLVATVTDSDGTTASGQVGSLTVINQSNPFATGLPGGSSNDPPIDVDGDGLYEDMDGNGRFTFTDVIEFVFALQNGDYSSYSQSTIATLNHNDNDSRLNFQDVIDLVFELQN